MEIRTLTSRKMWCKVIYNQSGWQTSESSLRAIINIAPDMRAHFQCLWRYVEEEEEKGTEQKNIISNVKSHHELIEATLDARYLYFIITYYTQVLTWLQPSIA